MFPRVQIPHTSIRPALAADDRSAPAQPARAASPSPGEVAPRHISFSQPSSSSPATGGRRSSAHSQLAPAGSLLSQQHSLPQQLQEQPQPQENVTCWSSADRLNVSIGLMYALCNLAKELGAAAGFCVPRPQLLRRWLQVGGAVVCMWPGSVWLFTTLHERLMCACLAMAASAYQTVPCNLCASTCASASPLWFATAVAYCCHLLRCCCPQSGVKMKQVSPPTKLIYPPSAHDYTYYKSSTVAYFLVDEVKESLGKVLSMLKQAS